MLRFVTVVAGQWGGEATWVQGSQVATSPLPRRGAASRFRSVANRNRLAVKPPAGPHGGPSALVLGEY